MMPNSTVSTSSKHIIMSVSVYGEYIGGLVSDWPRQDDAIEVEEEDGFDQYGLSYCL
jgi:hypothetical protein